jgi:hypothetical protein
VLLLLHDDLTEPLHTHQLKQQHRTCRFLLVSTNTDTSFYASYLRGLFIYGVRLECHERLRFDSQQWQHIFFFSAASRPALTPIQRFNQYVPRGFPREQKRPLTPTRVEVKNVQNHTFHSPRVFMKWYLFKHREPLPWLPQTIYFRKAGLNSGAVLVFSWTLRKITTYFCEGSQCLSRIRIGHPSNTSL